MNQPKNTTTPTRPRRVSHRLRGFKYAQDGAYFVTICTNRQRCLFGDISDGAVNLSRIGNVVLEEWLLLPSRRSGVQLDRFVVMPDHVHGIIVLASQAVTLPAGDLTVAPTGNRHSTGLAKIVKGPEVNSLGAIIGQFKAGVTKRIRDELQRPQGSSLAAQLSRPHHPG